MTMEGEITLVGEGVTAPAGASSSNDSQRGSSVGKAQAVEGGQSTWVG